MRIAQLLIVAGCALSLPAFGDPIIYTANLAGVSESPPSSSAGTGFAEVILNLASNTLEVQVTFQGLTGSDTAAHIHCCTTTSLTGTVGVATQVPTFAGFPLAVTSGSYDHVFDLTQAATYNPAFVTAYGGTVSVAEAVLVAGLAADEAYLNIHTTQYPGGEIRGFLVPAPVPEPGSLLLLGTIALGMVLVRRCRTH
jgi:CHRD domain/PEP-CTERM motif